MSSVNQIKTRIQEASDTAVAAQFNSGVVITGFFF